jgi:hypothetical protein
MRILFVIKSVILLLALVADVGAGEPAAPKDKQREEALRRRRNLLVQQMLTTPEFPKLLSRFEAADDLAWLGGLERRHWQPLIDAVVKEGVGGPLFIDALAAAGPEAVPDILRAVRAVQPLEIGSSHPFLSDKAIALLGSLGRMGKAAAPGLPALRKMLAQEGISKSSQAAIRMVMANLGDESPENLDAIARDLKSDDGIAAMMWMLVLIRPGPWVSKEMAREVCNQFNAVPDDEVRRGEGLRFWAEMLGMLGERASPAAERLEKERKAALKTDHFGNIVLGSFAVARIQPRRQEEVLRDLARRLQRGMDNPEALFFFRHTPPFFDPAPSRTAGGLLNDPDAEVSEGAVLLLAAAGSEGRHAFAQVLEFVRGKADEDRRARAVTLLRYADLSQLPVLEAAMREEKSEQVRRQLGRLIESVKTGEPFP